MVERLEPAAQKRSRQFVWCNREPELEGLRAWQFARCEAQREHWRQVGRLVLQFGLEELEAEQWKLVLALSEAPA